MERKNIGLLLGQKKSSAGFTLIELLVASIIGVIVIGAAGFGLSQVLRASRDGNAAAERHSEVVRAYDFISDEIRKAELIEDDETNASGYTSDPNEEVVLALKIPGLDSDNDSSTNNESRVLYYVSNPPANSVWKGPKVLYRWGPPLNSNGEYTTGAWGEQPLIDEISSNTITLNCEGATTASTTDDWIASSASGFGACISPNNKTAQLYIDGEIAKTLGSNDIYKSNTKTFARSNQAASINLTSDETPSSALGGEFNCDGSGSCSVDTKIAVYKKNDSNEIQFEETISEGGSIKKSILADRRIQVESSTTATCASVSSCSPVTIDFKIDKTTKKIVPLSDYQSPGDDHKVKIYYNGMTILNDTTKVYPGQKTPYQFLKDKGVQFTEDTSTSPPTYKIVMNPNQALIAFEIGQNNQYLDAPTNSIINPGFDYQDNLVVITSNKLDYSPSP